MLGTLLLLHLPSVTDGDDEGVWWQEVYGGGASLAERKESYSPEAHVANMAGRGTRGSGSASDRPNDHRILQIFRFKIFRRLWLLQNSRF